MLYNYVQTKSTAIKTQNHQPLMILIVSVLTSLSPCFQSSLLLIFMRWIHFFAERQRATRELYEWPRGEALRLSAQIMLALLQRLGMQPRTAEIFKYIWNLFAKVKLILLFFYLHCSFFLWSWENDLKRLSWSFRVECEPRRMRRTVHEIRRREVDARRRSPIVERPRLGRRVRVHNPAHGSPESRRTRLRCPVRLRRPDNRAVWSLPVSVAQSSRPNWLWSSDSCEGPRVC